MIAVIDYGVGNLFSLAASLRYIGAESVVTADEKVINSASSVILPGVGAFADAKKKLDWGFDGVLSGDTTFLISGVSQYLSGIHSLGY